MSSARCSSKGAGLQSAASWKAKASHSRDNKTTRVCVRHWWDGASSKGPPPFSPFSPLFHPRAGARQSAQSRPSSWRNPQQPPWGPVAPRPSCNKARHLTLGAAVGADPLAGRACLQWRSQAEGVPAFWAAGAGHQPVSCMPAAALLAGGRRRPCACCCRRCCCCCCCLGGL